MERLSAPLEYLRGQAKKVRCSVRPINAYSLQDLKHQSRGEHVIAAAAHLTERRGKKDGERGSWYGTSFTLKTDGGRYIFAERRNFRPNSARLKPGEQPIYNMKTGALTSERNEREEADLTEQLKAAATTRLDQLRYLVMKNTFPIEVFDLKRNQIPDEELDRIRERTSQSILQNA